jgi:hypothetical protein
MSARLHGALSRYCKIKLRSLVTPSGRCKQSEGETLELLLTTHFPNSEVTSACSARCDWQVAVRVVTYR